VLEENGEVAFGHISKDDRVVQDILLNYTKIGDASRFYNEGWGASESKSLPVSRFCIGAGGSALGYR
jgi:hypothetical protein